MANGGFGRAVFAAAAVLGAAAGHAVDYAQTRLASWPSTRPGEDAEYRWSYKPKRRQTMAQQKRDAQKKRNRRK